MIALTTIVSKIPEPVLLMQCSDYLTHLTINFKKVFTQSKKDLVVMLRTLSLKHMKFNVK